MTDDSEEAIEHFAALAEEYCEFFESFQSLPVDDFLRGMHRRIALLYSAALALPDVFNDRGDDDDPADDGDDEAWKGKDTVPDFGSGFGLDSHDPDRISGKEWMTTFHALEKYLGARQRYQKMFAPYDLNAKEPDGGFLADDLCDIHRDLKDGLAKWQRGEREDAAWTWQLQFGNHYGAHMTCALTALHSLAFDFDIGVGPAPSLERREIQWTRLTNVASGLEADIAVARLRAEDIPAFTRGNDIVGIVGPGFQGSTARGVDVLVPADLLAKAREVLEIDRT